MNERSTKLYRNLFQVQIMHHYWLDEGPVAFEEMTDEAKKARRLQAYDVQSFLTVSPTETTAATLNALAAVYKNTSLGFFVAVPDGRKIPTDTVFEWFVTIKDANFFNYTAQTLRLQKIYTLLNTLDDKSYRYKENALVLSNLTGASRGTGSDKTYYLSQEIPKLAAADDRIESLILSGSTLKQLLSDQPGATTKTISSQAKKLPVFVHQGDIPAIHALVGLADTAPGRGIRLTDELPDQIFALIRLVATRLDNDAFSLVDNSGNAKASAPLFQIHFKNRCTIWQYINRSDGTLISEETNPLPLTYFGNAGTKQKPLTGLLKVIKNGNRITRLISEIFQ